MPFGRTTRLFHASHTFNKETMTKEDLKRRVCEAIRARRADIKAVAESVFAEPELGFKET